MRWARLKLVALVGIVFGVVGEHASSQGEDSIDLAFTGDFLGPGPFPETGQDWFGLGHMPTGLALTETRTEVSQAPSRCAGVVTRISAVDVNEPLFLVRGLPTFRSGPVDSAFEGNRFIYPAEELTVKLQSGKSYGFQAYGSAASAVGEVRVTDYEIQMYQGSRTQTLAVFPRLDWDGPPRLLWAGDLDRDSNLDVLLDLTESYSGHLYVLFLSSRAQDGQLVERVAEFPVNGC